MSKLEECLKFINASLITPKFLMDVEKWARFKSEKPLCDGDKIVTDMGQFCTKEKNIKAGASLSDYFNDKPGSFEYNLKYWDVTKIESEDSMSDYNCMVFIASCYSNDKKDIEAHSTNPAELFIFFVNDEKPSKNFPSFEMLKKDFESGKNQYNYRSLIERKNAQQAYSLVLFNECSDRLSLFSMVDFSFNNLSAMEDTGKVYKKLKAPIRFSSDEDFRKHVEEEDEKFFLKAGVDIKSLKKKKK